MQKEGGKKQARSNKQQGMYMHDYSNNAIQVCVTACTCSNQTYMYIIRDEKEGRRKEASKVKQTTRQSNKAMYMYVILHVSVHVFK